MVQPAVRTSPIADPALAAMWANKHLQHALVSSRWMFPVERQVNLAGRESLGGWVAVAATRRMLSCAASGKSLLWDITWQFQRDPELKLSTSVTHGDNHTAPPAWITYLRSRNFATPVRPSPSHTALLHLYFEAFYFLGTLKPCPRQHPGLPCLDLAIQGCQLLLKPISYSCQKALAVELVRAAPG